MKILAPSHAAAVLVALALVACASAPKPTQVAGTLQASEQVNPSTSQRPSPLLLRVYELKTAAAFNSADFMSLYQRDKAELGADLLAKEEFVLAPGESKKFAKTLAQETRFLGVVAAFRDVEHARWRSIVAVQPGRMHTLVIKADQLSVEAAMAASK
ncbi:type VI secretion system lipoprotein TssJ [Ramlibacter alkalitolerans]|uniref:Type VI secretion system lipoprotein TssJ n=1 Tax=Ramlibacter alkalitolerans TaxID=2039631 RepID=A0ABS1JUM7_9BURK|nr:type VI secretion system lipoprotein TssJ [Ramlibacter alkalitolerans]